MSTLPAFRRKTRGLSLARRILIGALLWSVLIVVGGVVAISAVYQAQTINLLDDDLDSTLVTLARAIEPLDDNSGSDPGYSGALALRSPFRNASIRTVLGDHCGR